MKNPSRLTHASSSSPPPTGKAGSTSGAGVNSLELFTVPATPRTRKTNREECKELKSRYGIQTDCMVEGERIGTVIRYRRNWMALSMPAACAKLEDYGLTEKEKTSLIDIMMGYCRLLEECGLLIDGEPTEFEAVKKAATAAEIGKLEGAE